LRRLVEMGKVLPAVNQVHIPVLEHPRLALSPILSPLSCVLTSGVADPRPPVQLCDVE
jgi:hypothetical protein